MKKTIALFLLFAMASCTDTGMALFAALASPGEIKCFSGGKEIYSGKSTGKIATVHNSDGWEFKEEGTGDFIRVSGDCVIRN